MAIPFVLPPRGRVSLVYGEVAHGPSLAAREPEALTEALELHDSLVRRLAARHGGHVVRVEGYHFLAAWEKVESALSFASALQRELLDLNWPLALLALPEGAVVRGQDDTVTERGLRTRIAVHYGLPEILDGERPRNPQYRGLPVSHVARVCYAAWPGQVLVTAAAERVIGELPPGLSLASTGYVRLRGLHGSEELWVLCDALLSARPVRRPRTLDAELSNLADTSENFVGREAELSALRELFDFGVRCVAVVGPPGSGRSRLVRRFAELELQTGELTGGAWVVRVASARGLLGLLRGVASVLDVSIALCRNIDDAVQLLGQALAARGPLLLVLDDVDFAGPRGLQVIRGWLQGAEQLRVVLSAPHAHASPTGVQFSLGGLTLPEEGDADAVRWFEQVARRSRPSYRVFGGDLRPVFELVRLLDGSPLAIELVGSRVDDAAPVDLLDALTARVTAVAPGPGRAVRLALDWSWEQLRLWERDALAQCAVFVDGFDVDAARAVVDLGEHLGAPAIEDALDRLVDYGLIIRFQAQQAPGVARFRLPAPVAAHAAGWLGAAQRQDVEVRHARWAVDVVERSAAAAHLHGRPEAIARLELEIANLVAAHHRALAVDVPTPEAIELGLRGAIALAPLFEMLGSPVELVSLVDAVLSAPVADRALDDRLRVRAYLVRAEAHLRRGLLAEAKGDLEIARIVSRDLRDEVGEAHVLLALGTYWRTEGRDEEAVPVLEQAADLARELALPGLRGQALAGLGGCAHRRGEVELARSLFDHALALAQEAGDARAEAHTLTAIGVLLRQAGDEAGAKANYLEAIRAHRRAGDRLREATTLVNLGALEVHAGRAADGRACCEQARAVGRDIGSHLIEGSACANLGLVALEAGDLPGAIAQLEAAVELLERGPSVAPLGAVLGQLGLARWRHGELGRAREHFAEAARLLAKARDSRMEAAVRSWAGAMEIEAGELDVGVQLLAHAEALLPPGADRGLRGALGLLLAGRDLALAPAGDPGPIQAAEAALSAARALPTTVDLRLASGWLTSRLALTRTSPTPR